MCTQPQIPCVSVETMRESDRMTIERFTPSPVLMYRAAMGVYLATDWPGRTVIAVGPGNNGGDGFALAWIMKRRGHDCRVVSVSDKRSPDGEHYARLAEAVGVPIAPWTPDAFADCETVVDCLLGTGFQGSLREPYSTVIAALNACGARVVSVDINSGMNGDTGEAECAVRSDLTVTIGFVKTGLVAENAGRYLKRLVVADIGIVLCREEVAICPAETRTAACRADRCRPCPPWLETTPIDVSKQTP